jgi:hypothetical protein
MGRFDAADERFGHQVPLPFRDVAIHHHHWRESLFFVAQSPDGPDDVAILTLAHFPARREMDSLQLGRWGGKPVVARHHRPADGDHDDWRVGPVSIEVLEPRRRVRIAVADSPSSPVSLDLTFTARTEPHQLRRGTMLAGHEVIWDQTHMIQSGWWDGTVTRDGATREIRRWWGQRDHSWGIRVHHRCPMWMWLAIQLPEGMLGVWCWELPNGARVYTDGCFAPGDFSDPVPVTAFSHDLHWRDGLGRDVSYERHGSSVRGLAGNCSARLANGRTIDIEVDGRWAQRYDAFNPGAPDALGGGLMECTVTASDGQRGTGIVEVTGQWHHRHFPLHRGDRLPPDGRTPDPDERP